VAASDQRLSGAGIPGDQLVVFWRSVDGLRADQHDNSRRGRGGGREGMIVGSPESSTPRNAGGATLVRSIRVTMGLLAPLDSVATAEIGS
jgi:hypothetical protein